MTFSVDPTSIDAGVFAPGDSKDFQVTFSDVPPDTSGAGKVTISLGGVSVDVSVLATADNPLPVYEATLDPALTNQGMSVSVLDLNVDGATIRIARA